MTLTSTIPGAIATLQGYMNTVASQYPTLNVGVYLGEPVENLTNNFMAVGNYGTWELFSPGKGGWPVVPAATRYRTEEYAIHGCMRCWAGNSDPQGRLDDVFGLWDGLYEQIVSDIGGSGNLSPSGSWGDMEWRMEANGPLGGSGWGVVLGFDLHVINVQITG